MADIYIRQLQLTDEGGTIELRFKNIINAKRPGEKKENGFIRFYDDYGIEVEVKEDRIYRDMICDLTMKKKGDEELEICSVMAQKKLGERMAALALLTGPKGNPPG